MAHASAACLLTLNLGSSSHKAALYRIAAATSPGATADETVELVAQVERIGRAGSRLRVVDASGAALLDQPRALTDFDAALGALFAWLREQRRDADLAAVGHRVVHGGSQYREPVLVDAALIAALEGLVPIDPEHLPQTLGAIRAAGRAYPALPQVACFDTAFHGHMPRVAQLYALPRDIAEAGVVRYGFHGLSYEYIVQALRAEDPAAANGRLIIAHLGNGASMAAVRQGVGVDTTMGFTPTGGLVMGTRTGDLDPGVLLYLLAQRGLSAADLSALVNRQAGMLGVSGTSGEVRDLLEREAADPRAAEALALFCYQARKFVGALAAVLGGLDTLVFTGGIGEHAAPVRARLCAGLEFLGVELDAARNAAHAPIIATDGSRVVIRVMQTDEDRMIARHTYRVLEQRGADRVSV